MADVPRASTLDQSEIDKFAALAAEWWNPNGPFGALHRINPLRLQYIRDLAKQHFPPPQAGEVAIRSERAGASGGASPLSHAARDSSPAGGGANKSRALDGLTALDLGCGGGLVSAPLARMGAAVTG